MCLKIAIHLHVICHVLKMCLKIAIHLHVICNVLKMYLKIAIHLHVMPCIRDVFENSHTSTCYATY